MKRRLSVLILSVFVLSLCLTACQHSHKFGEWIVVVPAKCEETGIERCPCECGDYQERYLPAKGHSVSGWIVDVEPTEEETGVKHRECFDCKETLETEYIPKKNP